VEVHHHRDIRERPGRSGERDNSDEDERETSAPPCHGEEKSDAEERQQRDEGEPCCSHESSLDHWSRLSLRRAGDDVKQGSDLSIRIALAQSQFEPQEIAVAFHAPLELIGTHEVVVHAPDTQRRLHA